MTSTNFSLLEPLQTLQAEFAQYDYGLQEKVLDLVEEFGGWRHCNSDGNTYYRALGFAVVEAILRKKPKKLQQIVTVLRSCGETNETEALVHFLNSLQDMDKSEALLEWYRALCFDPSLDKQLTRCMRLVSADFLRKNPEALFNDVPLNLLVESAGSSMDDFIRSVLVQDGVEADQLALALAPMAFGTKVDIIQVDESAQPPQRFEVPDSKEGHALAVILSRPRHFDIFYSQNAAKEIMQLQEQIPKGQGGSSSANGGVPGRRKEGGSGGQGGGPSLLTGRAHGGSARGAGVDGSLSDLRQSLQSSVKSAEAMIGQHKQMIETHQQKIAEQREQNQNAEDALAADRADLAAKREMLHTSTEEVSKLRQEIEAFNRKGGGLFACCASPGPTTGGELSVVSEPFDAGAQ